MKFVKSFVLLILLAVSFTLSSCGDIGNPTEGLEVRLNNIVRTTYVSVDFIDAASGDAVSKPVEVRFGGSYAQSIISTANEPLEVVYSEEGKILFSLEDEIKPTEENPVYINIIGKADDYLNTSKRIVITGEGVSNHSINMTNLADLPKGVSTNRVSTGSTHSNTGTSEDIDVSSGTEPSSGASAGIKIPKGTLLYGADGQALGGNVETRVTYFNPKDDESLESFPGGFDVEVETEEGTMEEGSFVTAGFVAVDMTVAGKEVESFSNNITVSVSIPEGTINPETGNTVQPGDVIPMWSYDEDTGEWVFEGNTVVSAPSKPGALMSVTYDKMNHLSYWNMDWYYSARCSYPYPRLSFEITGDANACAGGQYYYLKARPQSGYGYLYSGYVNNLNEDVMIYNAPANLPLTITLHESYYGPAIASVNVNNLCEGVNFQIPSSAISSNMTNVSIDISARCNDGDNPKVVQIDGYPIYAREDGSYRWFYAGQLDNGKMDMCLKLNGEYHFAALYKGRWYYSQNFNDGKPYTIDRAEITYVIEDQPEICSDL